MDAQVWARIKALKPAPAQFVWLSTGFGGQGTYKQPDNNRRLKRLAIRDHGYRQFKRSGVLRQYNIAQRGVANV
jgi:hypothetical protein